MRSKKVHLDLAARLVSCALLLAISDSAFAQPTESSPALPPLPAPENEPAPPPTAPSAPSASVPEPATPPPTRIASPSVSATVPEEEAPETTPVITFANIPKLVVTSVGLGYSFPNQRDANAQGSGFYASGEFVLVPNMWFSPRVYGGLLLTSADSSTCGGATPCNVAAKIGFLGAKGRLTIPIPYVAPFFELGVGMSAGVITTQVDDIVAKSFSGLTYHVPVALGLSFGEMHHYFVDVAFSYLFHPDQSQFEGALALSLAFPL